MDATGSDLSFAACRVSPARRQLWRDGQPAQLGARAFDLLLALVERRERFVSANELLDIVWAHRVVEENNLRVHICTLRKLLGPGVIATIPGRGYRFTVLLDEVTPDGQASQPLAPPAPRSTAPTTNLPEHLPPLYGRADDVQRVAALVLAQSLVTLLGAGGIGKTRLARAVAQQLRAHWPDGAWAVELAATANPALVPQVIAQALGITLAGPEDLPSRWVAGLAGKEMLVLLDNCEHLAGAVAAWVAQALMHAPGVRVLVTSQVPLHLAEEQPYRVAPLAVRQPVPAAEARGYGAVALFEARAQGVAPRFALDEANVGAVIYICRQLDGLPLAIELAAARVPVLGAHGVRDRLAQRFRLLAGGASTATHARHQTLHAAIEWSHALLEPREQVSFRRLGVFAGGFTLELARTALADAESGDEWDLIDDLATLVERSLVEADAGEPPRYRLLESTRAFALEQLAAAGEGEAMRRRHALAVHAFMAQSSNDRQSGRTSIDALAARIALELDNIRAALGWAMGERGEFEIALALVTITWPFIRFLGLKHECLGWMLQLEDRVGSETRPTLAGAFWIGLGEMGHRNGLPAARRLVVMRRGEATLRGQGGDELVFRCAALYGMARIALSQGDPAAAQALLNEARSIVQPAWPPLYVACLAVRLAIVLAVERPSPDAESLYRHALPQLVAQGQEEFLSLVLVDVAELELLLGHVDDSVARWQMLANAARARRLHSEALGPLLVNLCGALTAQGALADAQAAAIEGLAHLHLLGDAREGSGFYAWLAARQGRLQDAALLAGAADAFAQRVGETRYLNEARARDAALGLVATRHAQAEIDAWRVQGAGLGEDAVVRLVTGA